LLCLKSSNRIMDDDEVLFVIVYSFPRNMLHVCCSFLKYKSLSAMYGK
jgi:hypothetical protein